jgi:hypothetical protein
MSRKGVARDVSSLTDGFGKWEGGLSRFSQASVYAAFSGGSAGEGQLCAPRVW